MGDCKHENADHLKAGDYYSNGQPFGTIVVRCEQFRCIDCGAWLSLGAANDRGVPSTELRLADAVSRIADGFRDELVDSAIDYWLEQDAWERDERRRRMRRVRHG